MPDAKCLNRRLHLLLDSFYDYHSDSFTEKNNLNNLEFDNDTLVSEEWRKAVKSNANVLEKAKSLISSGKEILSNSPKLKNGVEFSTSDTPENLVNVTNIQVLSKHLIGSGIPNSISRYGISAIVHSDHRSLNKVTEVEKNSRRKFLRIVRL